uniref:G_PROTEIN_RECEP_F1_2 domain-containing protein n=1 Tax=Heterorhabditis bacteriophora TaxID=37862 RepID=A0A1I7XNP7_HETBA
MNGEITTPALLSSQPLLNDGRTVTSDVIVGFFMMLISVLCALAYGAILLTIWKDSNLIRMTSYRFMFALGVFDVIQCLPHFVTGLFTVFQTVWHPLLAKGWFGIGIVSWLAYVIALGSPWAAIIYIPDITVREQITSTKQVVTTVSVFTRSPMTQAITETMDKVNTNYQFKMMKKQYNVG